MAQDKLRWGILGTGNIARVFAKGLASCATGELYAVASRTTDKAQAFGNEFNVAARYGSYEELLADPKVQVVYLALPHVSHSEWAIKAAEAGKHILCEKPAAINQAQVGAMVEAARRKDVFLMEAFMYRCHPQTARLVELIRAKAIGEVRVIQGTFSFQAEYDPANGAFSNAMGGGGVLDVGCYPVSMARLIAGTALGKAYAEPIEVSGSAHIGEKSGIDEWAVCSMKFPGGILAQVSTGVFLAQENVVRIFGSEGDIMIPSPWVPGGREPGITRIFLRKRGEKQPQELILETQTGLCAMLADAVAVGIPKRQSPAMDWEDSLGNARTLDLWRKAAGIKYPADVPGGKV